jgi:hypothetical protein
MLFHREARQFGREMAGLEDQLGLKSVPSRGPMHVVPIERMEKPDAS